MIARRPPKRITILPRQPRPLIRRHSLISRARPHDLQEEHAHKHHNRRPTRQQQQIPRSIIRKREIRHQRIKKRTQPKRRKRERRRRPPMLRPIRRRNLNRSAKRRATPHPRQHGEEAQRRHAQAPRPIIVCGAQGEVSARQCYEAGEDAPARPSRVDEDAAGDPHGVHADVAEVADEVAVGGGEVEALGELGGPGGVGVVRAGGEGDTCGKARGG